MTVGRLDSLTTVRVAAGHSISRLAFLANVSDLTIRMLEDDGLNGLPIGGTANLDVIDRIVAALGSTRVACGFVALER